MAKDERKEPDWKKMPDLPVIDLDAAIKRSVTEAAAQCDALDAEAEQVSAELDLLHKEKARKNEDFQRANNKYIEHENSKKKK